MTEASKTEPSRQDLAVASESGSEPGLALIEQRLGHALGQEQRVPIALSLKWLADAWRSHLSSVPDGTEPDFVFHPTPVSSSNRPTRAVGEVGTPAQKASRD